jgi:rod shape-determining protein MreD
MVNRRFKVSALSLVLLGTAVVLQSTLLEYVAIGEVKPDLSLVILVFTALRTGALFGQYAGFAAGLVEDFVSLPPLGFYALIRTVLGFLSGLLHGGFYVDPLFMPVVLVVAATVLKGLLAWLLSLVFSLSAPVAAFLGAKFWIEVGYNALIAPFAFALLNLIKLYRVQERRGEI